MSLNGEPTKCNDLIRRLDIAVEAGECAEICHAVKDVLHDIVAEGNAFIADRFLVPAPERYARRLFHLDPAGRYSVLVMVWDKGQGTMLHDHSGMWCVECVYQGRIKVVSYDRLDDETGELAQFEREQELYAGIADAGALIPPYEYHTIENCEDTPAVTIHVYGGEMTSCHVFAPVEGGYRREERQLAYTQ